jgi:hypothetical protein
MQVAMHAPITRERQSEKIHLPLSTSMLAELRALADRNDRPVAREVRAAIRSHLEREREAAD